MTVIEQFAHFAVDYGEGQFDDTAEHAAARAVVDWFSATVPGAEMPPARILERALVPDDAVGPARLVRSGRACAAETAALINGTASHTAELDDIYRDGIYHPGSPVVAAALAVGERTSSSGLDLLRAVVVGYEVSDRIAAAVNPAHYRYWHTTGTVGTIGAAAGAAVLLRLGIVETGHALATATTGAAGLQQAFRSDAMSKPLHAGHAAHAGVVSALAASEGFTGALDVLEGDVGFGFAMGGAPDWGRATDGLGTTLLIGEATVKNHSCCGHIFAAIDALGELARDHSLSIDDIASVEVATYGTALEVAGTREPSSTFEAKFSIPYCIGAQLVLGSVRLRAFSEEALADPRIRRIAAVTTMEVDPEFDAAFPTQRGARVTVTTRDGACHQSVRQTRKGDPDDPLTDDELQAKFDETVGSVYDDGSRSALSSALWRLGEIEDLRQLRFGHAERDLAAASAL